MNNENFSAQELLRMAKAAKDDEPDKLLEKVGEKLTQEKKNEIFRILGDKKALEELLKSEQAQKLMKQFKK